MRERLRRMTIIECPHKSIDWSYSYCSGKDSSATGQCHTCGLFIDERNGRFYLYDGREINLDLGE